MGILWKSGCQYQWFSKGTCGKAVENWPGQTGKTERFVRTGSGSRCCVDIHRISTAPPPRNRYVFAFCAPFQLFSGCRGLPTCGKFSTGTSTTSVSARIGSSTRGTARTTPANSPPPAAHRPPATGRCDPPCATALPRSARTAAARAGSCGTAAPRSNRSLARWSRAGYRAGVAGRAWRRSAQDTRRSGLGSSGCTSGAGRWAWLYFTPPSPRRGSCGGGVRITPFRAHDLLTLALPATRRQAEPIPRRCAER